MKISQIVPFLLFLTCSSAKDWNWKIEGYVACLDYDAQKWQHLEGAKLDFWEHDTFDPNDHMGETTTAEDGSFAISGKESEMTTPKPFFVITHSCKDPEKPLPNSKCVYKTTLYIPPEPEQQTLTIGLGDQEYGFSKATSGKPVGNKELKLSTEVICE